MLTEHNEFPRKEHLIDVLKYRYRFDIDLRASITYALRAIFFLQFLSAIRLHGDETARSKVFILNKKCLIKYVIMNIRVFETETDA